MSLEVLDRLFYLSQLMMTIPIVLLLMQFNRQPAAYKWLAGALMLSVACDLFAEWLYLNHMQPNIASAIYETLKPIFFSYFFYHVLKGKNSKVPLLIGIAFSLLSAANGLFIQRMVITSYSTTISNLCIIVLSIVYFFKLLQELPEERVYRIGMFWVVTSLLFLGLSKAIIFSSTSYLRDVLGDNLIGFVFMNHVATILSTLIVTYGVWLNFNKLRRLV